LREGARVTGRQRDQRDVALERDREEFMQELEQDPELRATVNLYKDPTKFVEDGLGRLGIRYPGDRKWTASERAQGQSRRNVQNANRFDGQRGMNAYAVLEADTDADESDDYPSVSLDELLDGLDISDDADQGQDAVTS
jgi:nonsense-mediated mRNA decay protein 3